MTTTSAPARHDEAEHRHAANRAVAVSALGLAVTGVVELALALLCGSVALLGDALHNLSDVSTSAVVFLGFRVSKKAPTDSYPFGFDKAEDLAGLGVALVIWASAVFAGVESYRKLVGDAQTGHVYLGMAGAVLGIIGNQVVARYKLAIGERIHSNTLVADAQHSWLDALSSAGALAGLVGVAAGYRWADPVAGLAVTVFIAHVGWEVTSAVVRNLMDGIDPDALVAARAAAAAVAGVHGATVRGRWAGRVLTFEVDGAVDPELSLAAADRIGVQVRQAVLAAVGDARDVRWSARVR